MIKLEICANSVASALAGQSGGAYRIELCENLAIGGVTPPHKDILTARKQLHIDLYILIRPRGGDFVYTDAEFETMLADLKYCIDAGCDGIVTGMLISDGTIDKERCTQLVNLAKQAESGITFHRAFDECADQFNALEEIIEMGFDRILTSGGANTAIEGANRIAQLVEKAAGRISIMPGSGINETNVADIIKRTGVYEIHSSARVENTTAVEKVKAILQLVNC